MRRSPVLRIGAFALLAAAPLAALHAQTMTVASFLTKATPLEKKNPATLIFSKDARMLGREIGNASKSLRSDQEASVRAGRTPIACLPPKGKAKLDIPGLMAHLRAIPAAQRQMSFRTGFNGYMKKKYPCPAR